MSNLPMSGIRVERIIDKAVKERALRKTMVTPQIFSGVDGAL